MTEDNTERAARDDVHDDPPGPADHGRDGGMATRENAPDAVRRTDTDDEDSQAPRGRR
ncbi:hypothetical protein C8K36_1011402 [Rhodococcus sp. OK519]|uniref:hypothetical protein n=1 Tax=Rhodococcus sp. OK519 TaxID=2135729 RepID=UPI000D4FBA6A|nr:hypothetical protein C8K36_1011402 [Rhodococcus sp. OK519]